MKKLLIAMLVASALSACGRQEKLTLEQALLEKLQADSDLKDYKIDPKDMTGCVIEEISKSLPVMPMDNQRGLYFEAYAKFVTATDPTKAIQDAVPLFGSVKDARVAALSITDHIMYCMERLVDQRQPAEEERPAPAAPQPPAKPAN
ncbi:MAG: hypothetical protein EPN21_11105 [Methylococcaceae bacterium]|nr:MAG: hypothetical protein EPN21_11105 [Methylococcaceae bacterium]